MFDTQLHILGFRPSPENQNTLTLDVNSYTLTVEINSSDWKKSQINYGSKIRVWHDGVCNFEKAENLVQLECIIRLLRKGYRPKDIQLEKTFPLGRRTKGRLDIYITKKGKCWAMIECKTDGEEYKKELRKVQVSGGQIFSYFAQDRDAEVLAIYSSRMEDRTIFLSEQILTNTLDKAGSAETIHQSWDKSFVRTGLFDDGSSPYDIELKDRKKGDLIDLDKESGRGLFNAFAEVIRRHVISDKSNAFNIIFNLFVCKIFDEDTKADSEVLDFQWKSGDDYESLLGRLSHLYRQSMAKYLGLEIDERYHINYSEGTRIALREFGFIDVVNDETFEENAAIVKDVVALLQSYRIKYSTKHQFLGEFFENLLHIGVKQESGQFFTPIPLARFMVRSLPIDSIISRRIAAKEPFILPFLVDYACGSGHFLTEGIEEIAEYFDAIRVSDLPGQARRNFESTKNNFLWARDYLYGIEKDHRLAKTTKIALFLNGDGDATILSADGLDDFHTSRKYVGKLKSPKPASAVNTFDMLVTNPPFSVDGFSRSVPNASRNFYLSQFVTEKSTEIECFFVERMIQLLFEDGVGAIILPLSILNSERSVYVQARYLLMLFCQLVAVVELREKAMMATGTNLVIIFLRKRKWTETLAVFDALISPLADKKKRVVPPEFSHLSQEDLDDLVSKIKEQQQVWHRHKTDEYTNITPFDKRIVRAVIARFSNASDSIVAFSGEKKRQEFFLGYRFSRARGREGLTTLRKSLLFDKNNRDNPECVNGHIRACYLGNTLPLVEGSEFAKHLRYLPTGDLIQNEGDAWTLRTPSSFLGKRTLKIESLSPYGDFINEWESENISIKSLVDAKEVQCLSGVTYDKAKDEVPYKTKVGVLTASNIDILTGRIILEPKLLFLRDDFPLDENLRVRKWDIVMSNASGSLKHLGKVALADKDYEQIIGGFISIIRCHDPELAVSLYFRLLSKEFRELMFTKKQQNINNFVVSTNMSNT